jgi:large subunit ribosomal protein L29
MPILRMQEIREMSSEDRDVKLQELRTELRKVRTMIKAGGAIENPGRTKVLRRTIAKILTVINEEE